MTEPMTEPMTDQMTEPMTAEPLDRPDPPHQVGPGPRGPRAVARWLLFPLAPLVLVARGLGRLRHLHGWGLVVLPTLLGLGAGAGYAAVKTPSYTADAYVIVVAANPSADGGGPAVNFAQAYGRIATQGVIVARAAALLGEPPAVLTRQVRAVTSPDAPIIQISGAAGGAERAAARANALAEALVAYGGTHRDDTRVRLSSFAQAMPPSGPSSPNLLLDVAVGAAAGLLTGGLMVLGELDGARAGSRHRRGSDVLTSQPTAVGGPPVSDGPADEGSPAGAAVGDRDGQVPPAAPASPRTSRETAR